MTTSFSNLSCSLLTCFNVAKSTFSLGNIQVSHFLSVRISLWFSHTFRDLPKIHEENSSSYLQPVFLFLYFYLLKKRPLSKNLLAAATNQIIQSNHYQINLTYFVTHTLLILTFFLEKKYGTYILL